MTSIPDTSLIGSYILHKDYFNFTMTAILNRHAAHYHAIIIIIIIIKQNTYIRFSLIIPIASFNQFFFENHIYVQVSKVTAASPGWESQFKQVDHLQGLLTSTTV